jgi:hypothetical protein
LAPLAGRSDKLGMPAFGSKAALGGHVARCENENCGLRHQPMPGPRGRDGSRCVMPGRDGGALGAQDWVSQERERPARLGMDHCEVSRRDEIIPGRYGHCEVIATVARLPKLPLQESVRSRQPHVGGLPGATLADLMSAAGGAAM